MHARGEHRHALNRRGAAGKQRLCIGPVSIGRDWHGRRRYACRVEDGTGTYRTGEAGAASIEVSTTGARSIGAAKQDRHAGTGQHGMGSTWAGTAGEQWLACACSALRAIGKAWLGRNGELR